MSDHIRVRLTRVEADARIPLERWGMALRLARENLRMTQEELGERTGVSQQAISKVERGIVCPNDRTKVMLARALGADVGVLFGWPATAHKASSSGGSGPSPT